MGRPPKPPTEEAETTPVRRPWSSPVEKTIAAVAFALFFVVVLAVTLGLVRLAKFPWLG